MAFEIGDDAVDLVMSFGGGRVALLNETKPDGDVRYIFMVYDYDNMSLHIELTREDVVALAKGLLTTIDDEIGRTMEAKE